MPEVQMPRDGETIQPFEGMAVWRNPMNGFLVARTHYTADPSRRGDWKYRASPKYGGLKSWRWRKEQEIDWEAQSGRLVFETWNPGIHCIRPFVIPAHWPRWIMFDPGWTNPAAIDWIAVDVDAEPNDFGYLPIHVYREFYRSHHSAKACAAICHDWSQNGEGEWIEAIILDPAAKQEHQAAAGNPENVSYQAASVLEQFEDAIQKLGWDVPVDTGNNSKGDAIEELISRLGAYWIDRNGVPLVDEDDSFREPTLADLAEGAELVPPTIFFHHTVVDAPREMAKYRWRDWASAQVAERNNAPESPVDKDDHAITNLIRFANLMRDMRGESDRDLADFHPRPKPTEWTAPDDAMAEAHRKAVANYRRKLTRLNRR